jgi:ATP-dependent Lon protease
MDTDTPELPRDVVPLVPMRNVVLFPHVMMPITVGREKSIAAVQHAMQAGVQFEAGAAVLFPFFVLAAVHQLGVFLE